MSSRPGSRLLFAVTITITIAIAITIITVPTITTTMVIREAGRRHKTADASAGPAPLTYYSIISSYS